MPTEAKRIAIDELAERIGRSQAVFVVEYRGLTVAKSTALRKAIRGTDGEMKVAKNTLMNKALSEQGSPTSNDFEVGPNAFIFAFSDAAATAKVIRDFSRERGNEKLKIKGGILGGKVLNKDQIFALADLPSRDVMLAMTLGTLIAPIRGFVTVLAGPSRGLVTALSRIKEQKEEAAA